MWSRFKTQSMGKKVPYLCHSTELCSHVQTDLKDWSPEKESQDEKNKNLTKKGTEYFLVPKIYRDCQNFREYQYSGPKHYTRSE